MQITFYGAAGGVTGSKHLLEVEGAKILLDCGIFQGLPDVRERNRSLPFPPESIDHVVLSHAHLDHSGMLPVLVKRGFTGSIFTTPATRDVVQHMLEDAAGIEEQDAVYRIRHHIGPPDEREPLFTQDDVVAAMRQFVPLPYIREQNEWHVVEKGIKLKFYDAGHILGSAVTVIEAGGSCLGYTGDLGPQGMPLLFDPQVPQEEIPTLLLESTYGSLVHDPIGQTVDRLAETIRAVCDRRGKIIVPAFSLGRTQVLVYLIHKLTDEGRIPHLPIYVDSPLATDVTEVYRRHEHDYDKETQQDFPGQEKGSGHAPLAFQNLKYVRSSEESKMLNDAKGPLMIISASGMMTAGRVVHHLRHSISNAKNAIFITGYQAKGTLGRRLLEGAKRVELYGDYFTVRAQLFLFNEFSAHADANELQRYAEKIKGLQRIMLVHGEPHHAGDLQAQLLRSHPDWRVERPEEGETLEF